MSKSIYSLCLSDEIILHIDELAFSKGISRSAMIEQILAEKISFTTPKQHAENICRNLETNFPKNFIIVQGTADNLVQVRRSLKFKYNPAVRYTVFFYKNTYLNGEIRVSLRSQNSVCQKLFDIFFRLIENIEVTTVKASPDIYELGNNTWKRKFILKNPSDAELLTKYITLIDSCMQYFYSYYSDDDIEKQIKNMYISGISFN